MSVFLRIDSLPPPYHKSEWEITFAGDNKISVPYLAWLSTITEDNPTNHVLTQGGESLGIRNVGDAREVDGALERVFAAGSEEERAREIQRMFVEALDFDVVDNLVPLDRAGNDALPSDARRVARRGGVSAVYIPATSERVGAGLAGAAAKVVGEILEDDVLLLFTNRDCGQLHIIHPDLSGRRPRLRRMVVHRDEKRRTVVQQIANMWGDYGRGGKTVVDAVEAAFDVEPVTRAFFAAYKQVFEDAKRIITGFEDGERLHLFTQTLFNRLMFIEFIQRKRWLSFDGDTDYLNALWRSYQNDEGSDKNFYADRLRALFFGGLNNYRSEDVTGGSDADRLIGQVPFLNGGLFDCTDLDRAGAYVPDDVIRSAMSGLFEKYNFTVMESTPFDQEVAVDPEMLGKVFEELVTGRHESGSYYTPREVVAFMCRESLKGYLAGRVEGLSEENITQFVDERDSSAVPINLAPQVAGALREVAVVDPACGSGAYLLGMMQELVELQTVLYATEPTTDDLYVLKRDIISRNLYGADKDEFAVNIAMLRLWLSLAIEGDKPEALPNLDFKVVCGDSLLAPNPGQLRLERQFIEQSGIGELKATYMLAFEGDVKRELKEDIEEVYGRLRENIGGAAVPDGVVDWRVEFAEVFARGGGFDIVLANPPYVRQEQIKPDGYKRALAAQYADAATARSDLYCYFYARGLELLADGGTHVFVCSNSWLDVGYGARLQEYLLDAAHVEAVYESAVERQFSTAAINTLISVIRKGAQGEDAETRFVSLRDKFDTALSDPAHRREIAKPRSALQEAGRNPQTGKWVGDKWGGKYLRAPDIYHHILAAYGDRFVRLGDIATVRFGIKTGANEFFYLKPDRIAEWGIEDEFLAPVMTSPTESRSIVVDPATLPYRIFLCHKDKADLKGTGALAYIEWAEKNHDWHTRPSTRHRKNWYDLGKMTPPPITMNRIIDERAKAFTMPADTYADATLQEVHCEPDDVSPLADDLNDDFSQVQYNIEGRANFGGGALELKIYETENIRVSNQNVCTPPVEFTRGERDALREALVEMVRNRRLRAKSV